MELTSLNSILEAAKALPRKRVMAVAAAEDRPVIRSALRAWRDGLACPIFTGADQEIRRLIEKEGQRPEDFHILPAASVEQAAELAVQLVRNGEADILMKGLLDTGKLMKPVVNKQTGLHRGAPMTHLALYELPGYHKLIGNTDSGMLLYPELEDKKHILRHAAAVFHALGYKCPKFAVVCAVEKVNPKMRETVDAAALQEWNRRGELAGCVVEGPLSYDVAMSREIARHKGFSSPYCGDFDALVQPSLAAGNIMGKCWGVTCGARTAGIVMGAACPIVLSSRGASEEEKHLSIALAILTAGAENQ